MINMRPIDVAWKLLKGDYDQDMQQLQMLGGQETAQAITQRPVPAAYQGNPEGWAEDYMSNIADAQGSMAANVGDPNFDISRHLMPNVVGRNTAAGQRLAAAQREYEENQRRMAELDFIARQAQFEGHPRFRNYGQ